MNYRELLFKYMQHLYEAEESVFLELIHSPFSNTMFSDDEIATLREMEKILEKHRLHNELLGKSN